MTVAFVATKVFTSICGRLSLTFTTFLALDTAEWRGREGDVPVEKVAMAGRTEEEEILETDFNP